MREYVLPVLLGALAGTVLIVSGVLFIDPEEDSYPVPDSVAGYGAHQAGYMQ